jgi:hypothetical protein
MGNSNSKPISNSLQKNKNNINNDDSPRDFTKLSQSNAAFITKLNEIASTYILEQNFQDMTRLTNPDYCDDLVVLTSEILNQSYDESQINYAHQVIYKKGTNVGDTGDTGDIRNEKENVFKYC